MTRISKTYIDSLYLGCKQNSKWPMSLAYHPLVTDYEFL